MERVRYFLASHKKLVFACAAGVALLLVLLISIKILFLSVFLLFYTVDNEYYTVYNALIQLNKHRRCIL